jgi:hypothetical protein
MGLLKNEKGVSMRSAVRMVSFTSAEDAISLEGRMSLDPQRLPAPGIILCHPHPAYGGSMDNNVVSALLAALSQAGYVALAFNFRGVGRSQGRYEEGDGEVLDVKGAIRFLAGLPQTAGSGLGLWGYSFGAWVGMRAALQEESVLCLGAVAPPTALYSFDFLADLVRPVYFISGDRDPFCPVEARGPVLSRLKGPKEWRILSGADHFFWGQEGPMALFACEVFARHLPLGTP